MSIKKDLIKNIELFADLLEFKGENKFKINAFRNGANIIRRVEEDIELLIKNGEIENIKGIGKGISSFMTEFCETGKVSELDEIKSSIPDETFELFKIKGLGVKKIKFLMDNLEINNIDDLEKACDQHKISRLKGFGEKTEEKILEEIKRIRSVSGLLLIHQAEKISMEIIDSLKDLESITSIEVTGQLRRGNEIIDKIELLCLIEELKRFLSDIGNIYEYNELTINTLSCILIKSELFQNIFIYYATEKNYGEYLIRATGTPEFVDAFIRDIDFLDFRTEEEIFESAGSSYVIPEMREEEFLTADPELRRNSDLSIVSFKGFFHFHTTYSDGLNSLREMVIGARDQGFVYFVVCDHSKSAYYANGLVEKRVMEQKSEIERISKDEGVIIFHGIESDILADGSLDYSDAFLSNFDFIVGSVHSRFNLSEGEMTKRIIRAVENPHTDLLGHPTGRLLLSRDPYRVDLKKIIDACAENDVAIEINANPHRLDLDWRNIYYAREQGCRFAINPDSHSVESISEINYGIKIGRKGGLKTSEVINCLNINEFRKYINRKVKRIGK